jgi:glycosyltransferase involved in cell wall biosynthesis
VTGATSLADTPGVNSCMTRRIALVCSLSPGAVDGIRDYTVQLADALSRFDCVTADVVGRDAFNSDLAGYDAVVVQYNPFMYGRWGFAPWLPAALLRTRRKRRLLEIALMVHEPYVPMVNWRWTLMSLWQRSQLLALHVLADVVFASIDTWATMLARLRPRRPSHHLPVGSNLPDLRARRVEARASLGATDETVVLATFGTAHPSRQLDYVVEAANAVAESGIPTIVQNLGAGAPALHGIQRTVRVSQPGYQSPAVLAERLSATDLFLAPFVDGVSTRRTTVMAALQHGLPIVGTDGHLTDRLFHSSSRALELLPVARRDLFAEMALRLASRPEERAKLGLAARELYANHFEWAVIAARLQACLHAGDEAVPW